MYISIISLLNIPFFQEKISSFIALELSNKLHTEVSIGKVDIGLLNRIIIKDVHINDRSGKELLKVSHLSAKFEISPLLDNKVVISSVQIFDFLASIDKKNPNAPTNFQFIIDAFSNNDKPKTNSAVNLRINSLLIRNGNLRYDILSAPTTPGKFNVNHMAIQNIAGIISLKAFSSDSINARVRRLSFKEQSGLNLNRLSFRVMGNNNKLHINNIDVAFPNSTLRLDNIVFRYSNINNLFAFKDDVQYSGNINAQITPKDFSSLLPLFSDYDSRINLILRLSGNNSKLVCSRFNMTDHHGLDINGEAFINGFSKGRDMEIALSLFNSNVTKTNLKNISDHLKLSLPAPVLEREFINFKGEIAGPLKDLSLTGLLSSDIGKINSKILMSTNSEGIRSYSGIVSCNQLSMNRLLKNNDFGNVDFNIELKGFSYKDRFPTSYIKGKVNSFIFKGYTYHNIILDGNYKNGGFAGKLNLDDQNIYINLDGNFNIAEKIPSFNLQAQIRHFNPNKLLLTDKYKNSNLSLNINADFKGNSIDNIVGDLSIDSLRLEAPADSSYFLPYLNISSKLIDGNNDLTISAPFMSGKITGNYSYHTLPASIIRTIKRYLPSLVTIKNPNIVTDNNFNFDFNIENSDFFNKVLFIPVNLIKPAILKGYFNDNDGKIKIDAYLPRFKYNNSIYDSGILQCENVNNEFSCNLYGGILLKSGAMINLSIKNRAKNDTLSTILNWGNNTKNTYGGKFSTLTCFNKTDDNKLNAKIDIQPSKVVLNDSVWNIHKSEIDIRNDNIYVDNFVFEHSDQHIIINGNLTKNENDSCNINLKNINLEYVLDIVQFDDVLFGGLITGNVVLKNIMNSPDMYTNIKVKDFSLNGALLGDADIDGIWDKIYGNINLDARIADKDKKTHVTGFVSPKRSALDLNINANGTNIALISPFVEGIFSNINGLVYGNVRLYGDFKHLDLEGEAKANVEAKIEILNTYFRIINDSVHIKSGEIAFNKVKVEDREGNKGEVTGYLRHNKLKNLMYHFNVYGDNLLMYNTVQSNSVPFYGKVYGTGNVVINGGNNAMSIDASLRTAKNTTFTYLTTLPNEATNTQFITFVDKTPKRIQDNVEVNLYHPLNNPETKEENGPPMDLRINMLIDATPDATMKIIMDPVSGDNITATGNGNLQVNFYNKGDFRMFGNYIIDKGMYKLSMQEIIRKDFTLKSGGTVTFSGDPYLANLNVQAAYTVNSASLSDLGIGVSTTQGGQSTIKVNCLMNLTGSLADPTIKFDLELPTVNEEDRELVRSATSTEEQMNTQIIYLLGIGKFYTYDYANANTTQSSNATSSLAFSTLSGQLNNILSQWMDNKNWNIGANFSTGEKGWTDVEAEAILSGRLLNNRLLINGNFGYKDNALANTNFIGDFEAIWLLTKNGDWRMRGYNQTNDRYYMKSTLTTQGVGIMYKKDFNNWNDLFKWALWWKTPKKEKK